MKLTYIKRKITAILLSSAMAAFTVSAASGFDFGYNSYINGVKVGAFETESQAAGIADYIKRQDGIDVSKEVKTAFGLVDNNNLSDYKTAADIYRKTDSRYKMAYEISVSGTPIFYTDSYAEGKRAISDLISRYSEENADIKISDEPEIKNCYAVAENLSTYAEGVELLGESLSVEAIVKNTEYVYTPYGETLVNDDTMYKGERVVATNGIGGEKYVENTVVKVNGQQVESYVSGETVLSEPVNAIIKVGTKERPKGVATGSFINPTSGKLSSTFGARWGRRHTGIDVSAPCGTSIIAADGGTVIYSGWMSGYGKLIQVDHGNGYVTYYAHCSELLVGVGTKVNQGELIAKVGNTGNSTGNHLHFEVRKGGTPVDPLGYVKY